ncbi:hypothetical protein MCUN1_001090 [Malassezia cuniculi]|uniref:Association with the SNF1 complex (ASC) domain-containing protein n=1 Tax=Malassezia cuniculi TaxID=948313 RepID=A0AAF0EX31_9BASI|nr:hypothetical protein MCUN1_001090 [Malassezia cuniculi]
MGNTQSQVASAAEVPPAKVDGNDAAATDAAADGHEQTVTVHRPGHQYSHSINLPKESTGSSLPRTNTSTGIVNAGVTLPSMYMRGGSEMSLVSSRSTSSLVQSEDEGTASDSMHRMLSDSESDGDAIGALPPTRRLGNNFRFPPIQTGEDVEVEPSLLTPKARHAPTLSTPRANPPPLAPEVSPNHGDMSADTIMHGTSLPKGLASTSPTNNALSRRSPLLHHRASLIIQDDVLSTTLAESPPRGMGSTSTSPPSRPDTPGNEHSGRPLRSALPSYLKIPTIIPSSYASPSTSPPSSRRDQHTGQDTDSKDTELTPTGSEFPPRVVYSDQKQAARLAASLKEVQAHDVPKPFLAPVSLTWHGRGRRVFVTGTFAHEWRSKIPLRQTRAGGPFVCMLYLPPGTHRLKFIVDNRWRVSNELNTASDGDGNMVNYIEIPNVMQPTRATSESADDTSDDALAQAIADLRTQQQNIHTQPRGEWEEMLGDELSGSIDDTWTSDVPVSVEFAQETEEALHDNALGSDAQALLPMPPMMPPQLEKVILNSSPANMSGSICVPSSVVDDTSVLPAPNHAVLNHLAASAIKNGVLAVGSVQRYKRKYVTTLLYRPVQP